MCYFLAIDKNEITGTMKVMNKYSTCPFCKDEIEVHHITLHQRQCFLNPHNLEKICEYLLGGIEDNKKLKRANFYRWAQSQGILTSISITNRLKAETWYHALYQLLVYGYLLGFIDYEYAEVILYIVSDGSLWMDAEQYRMLYAESLKKEYENKGIEATDLYPNHYLLLMYILDRSNRDLALNDGDLDENKEVVDLEDAITFMAAFAPDVLHHRIEAGKVSYDAVNYL